MVNEYKPADLDDEQRTHQAALSMQADRLITAALQHIGGEYLSRPECILDAPTTAMALISGVQGALVRFFIEQTPQSEFLVTRDVVIGFRPMIMNYAEQILAARNHAIKLKPKGDAGAGEA